MSVTNFKDLVAHLGHNVEVVAYMSEDYPNRTAKVINVAIECYDCNEVLLDFDAEEENEEDDNFVMTYAD